MVKFLKPGKVVIVLHGRYAGKKAVIVQNYDQGAGEKPFGHALIAGVDRAPLKVTGAMSKARIAKRSAIKPFVKKVNYNHVMPTRYTLDVGDAMKNAVPNDVMEQGATARTAAKKEMKKIFQEKYSAGKNKWFFAKLRF